jgi:hypothetical protein
MSAGEERVRFSSRKRRCCLSVSPIASSTCDHV